MRIISLEAETEAEVIHARNNAEAGIYSGYGINGQQLFVHHPSNTVIARFSTWPVRWDEQLVAAVDAINGTLIDRLS